MRREQGFVCRDHGLAQLESCQDDRPCQGRAPNQFRHHIHVRIRTFSGSSTAFDYTTQIFFSDEQNNAVMTGAAPYKQRSPQTPDTSDGQDNILDESHSPNNAKTNVVSLSGSNSAGYSGTFDVALAGVTGGGGTVVAAGTIKSANVARTTTGKRLLTLVLTLHERTSVSARLTHGSTVLAKKSGTLAAARGRCVSRSAAGSLPSERASRSSSPGHRARRPHAGAA